MNGHLICLAVDEAFDAMLAKLGCNDGTDADLISHWQDGLGYRLQVTRKSDGKTLLRSVTLDGTIGN